MIMKKTENKAMTKRSIFRCLIAALCLVAITGCSEKNGSDAGVEPTSSHIRQSRLIQQRQQRATQQLRLLQRRL